MAGEFNQATLAEFQRKETAQPIETPNILVGTQWEWKTKTLDYGLAVKEHFRLPVNPNLENREIFHWGDVQASLGGDYWVSARLCFFLDTKFVGELPINFADNTSSGRFADAKVNFFPSDRPESGGQRFIEILRPNGFTGGPWVGSTLVLTGNQLRVRCDAIAYEVTYLSEAIPGSLTTGDIFLGVFSTPL